MAEIHIVFILAVNGHAIQDRHFNFDLIRRFKAIRHFDLLIALNRVGVDAFLAAIQNGQRLAVHRRAVAHAHGFEGDVSFRMRGEIRHDFLIHIVVVEGVMPTNLPSCVSSHFSKPVGIPSPVMKPVLQSLVSV